MHYSSMVLMAEFTAENDMTDKTVVDIGSMDINGTYKSLFPDSDYTGVDIKKGPNVDVIMDSKEWDNLKDIDVVISGQTLEHVEDRPRFMKSIHKILKSDGLICIIAPSGGPPHEPPWYGNISEDEMTKLVKGAGFNIIKCFIHPVHPWWDNVCIATKKKVIKNASKGN